MKYLLRIFLCSLIVFTTMPATAQEWKPVEIIGQGKIDDVVWLPDGRLAVFGVRGIWIYEEINPDAEPQLIEGSYGWIRTAAISGDVLATGHQDGSVTIWDAENLSETAHFAALGGPVTAIALTPDGTRVAIGSGQNGVQVWNVPTQTRILDLSRAEYIDDVAISPDGRWLYVLNRLSFGQTGDLGNPSQLYIIEIDDSQNQQRLDYIGSDRVEHLSVSPDGRWVALPGTQGLCIWDTQKRELIRTEIPATFSSIPFFTDHNLYLYRDYRDSTFSTITTDTWSSSESGDITEPFVASNGAWADPWIALVGYEGHYNETLRLWNRESGTVLDFPYQGAVDSITLVDDQIMVEYTLTATTALSADGHWRADWQAGKGLYLQDRITNSEKLLLSMVDTNTTSKQLIFAPDSQWVAALLIPGQWVSIWEVANGTLVYSFEASPIDAVAWSDTHFAVSTPERVTVLANGTWTVVSQLALPETNIDPYFHDLRLVLGREQVVVWDNLYPDNSSGECLGCGLPAKGFILYSTTFNDANLRKLLETEDFDPTDVALSPGESSLAVGTSGGQIYFIDLDTGQEITRFDSGAGAVTDLLFDRQGNLITAHESGIVQVWNVP